MGGEPGNEIVYQAIIIITHITAPLINQTIILQVVKAFLPWMIENDYGYIVSIASVVAFGGIPGLSAYSASKSAAYTFAEALRNELRAAKKTGITVTCVCPYHIRTGMFSGKGSVLAKELKSGAPPLLSIAFSFNVHGRKNLIKTTAML